MKKIESESECVSFSFADIRHLLGKGFTVFLIAALVLTVNFTFFSVAAAESAPRFEASVAGNELSNTVAITVSVSESDFSIWAFTVNYDTAVLEVASAYLLGIVESETFGFGQINIDVPGIITANWLTIEAEPVRLSGELCRINFKILSETPQKSDILISNAEAVGNSNNSGGIPCEVSPGAVFINSPYTGTIFKQNGAVITNGLETGVLEITPSVHNNKSSLPVKLIIVSYSDDDRLLSAYYSDYAISAPQNFEIDAGTEKVKVFYWNTAQYPYDKAWEISR